MYPILTESDKYYLAGLFDGEGTAGVWKSGKQACGTQRHRPCMAIGMTDREPVDFFRLCFGGSLYFNKHPRGPKGHQPHYKGLYLVSLRSNEVKRAAEILLPYCKNESKQKQLQVCLDWYTNKGKHNRVYSDFYAKVSRA